MSLVRPYADCTVISAVSAVDSDGRLGGRLGSCIVTCTSAALRLRSVGAGGECGTLNAAAEVQSVASMLTWIGAGIYITLVVAGVLLSSGVCV